MNTIDYKELNIIFNNDDVLETSEEQIEGLRYNDLKKYRTKTIKSGRILESESYPIWDISKRKLKEKLKKDIKRKEIEKKQRIKNAKKNMVRLINANFNRTDMWITVGYKNGAEPKNLEEAKKNVVNYIRRLKRISKKNNYDLKYVYVTERSKKGRYHHHIVTNFIDRDIAEEKWTLGEYPQSRRLKPNDFEFTGLAMYISKDIGNYEENKKSYGYSTNLIKTWQKPYMKKSDYKLSRRKAEKLSKYIIDPKEYYEKLYKGYRFLELEIRYSDYVSGCYLYAKMVKIKGKEEDR